MPTEAPDPRTELVNDYDRGMLRAAIASLFWAVIADRRKQGYKLKDLADALGCDKSQVSRWFSNDPPNWQIDTIADISSALDLDLRIEAIERKTGRRFSASGPSSLTPVPAPSAEPGAAMTRSS